MFKWLPKLLGVPTHEEMAGLCIEVQHGFWILEGNTEPSVFFRALPILVSGPAFIYLEDGSPSGELKDWLNCNQVEPPEKVALGTIWPRPHSFHIPLTSRTIEELAAISERIAYPELAIHTHLYEPGRMILEWHDAFGNDVHIDSHTPEHLVRDFAKMIGFSVTKETYSEQDGIE